MAKGKKKEEVTEKEGHYILKGDRLYDTATYEKVYRPSRKYDFQVTWDKSKKSKDVLVVPENGEAQYTQSQNGFHFYGSNFCCWRAHPDPHRVVQEILDYTMSSCRGLWERHLEQVEEGDIDPDGCFAISLYMVPGPNNQTYDLASGSSDQPVVDGTIFLGQYRVAGIADEEE